MAEPEFLHSASVSLHFAMSLIFETEITESYGERLAYFDGDHKWTLGCGR